MIATFGTKRANFGHSDKKVGFCNCLFSTGITVYMENGGSLETAAHIAAHESPRTTKLYDRTADNITLEEIERIRF
jgi:cytochrome c biogenesis protein ResB